MDGVECFAVRAPGFTHRASGSRRPVVGRQTGHRRTAKSCRARLRRLLAARCGLRQARGSPQELQATSIRSRNLVTTDLLGDSLTVSDASPWSVPRSLVFARRPCLPVSWASRPVTLPASVGCRPTHGHTRSLPSPLFFWRGGKVFISRLPASRGDMGFDAHVGSALKSPDAAQAPYSGAARSGGTAHGPKARITRAIRADVMAP